MNERIRILRERLKLSRAAFGEKIGVSGDVINNLERGRVEVKGHILKLICAEFHVSENWLRTGDGDMFPPMTRDKEIAAFARNLVSVEGDSFKKRFILGLACLDENGWKSLENIVNTIAEVEK